jgi:flagellar hook-length control protein FliK
MPNRPVEIMLKPQELGAVRLTVQQADTGIMVNLTAERPETLDLMRRHIDQLGQDFQAIGYTNIAFSFAGSDADPDAQQEEQAKEFSDTAEENAVLQTTQIYLSTSTNSGVDLRL